MNHDDNIRIEPMDNLDKRISDMLKHDLPDAERNPWFVRRVMNRLPEKRLFNRMSIVETICYVVAILGLVSAWAYAIRQAIDGGLTNQIMILSGLLTLLSLFVIGFLALPALRKAAI